MGELVERRFGGLPGLMHTGSGGPLRMSAQGIGMTSGNPKRGFEDEVPAHVSRVGGERANRLDVIFGALAGFDCRHETKGIMPDQVLRLADVESVAGGLSPDRE